MVNGSKQEHQHDSNLPPSGTALSSQYTDTSPVKLESHIQPLEVTTAKDGSEEEEKQAS